MRKKFLTIATTLLLVFSLSGVANAIPITIEIFASKYSSLNYQLYYKNEKYTNKVYFELTNLDTKETIDLSSRRSYLYLKGLSAGNYLLKTKSLKFIKYYYITIDDSHMQNSNSTKILNLDYFNNDTDNPSEIVVESEQLFPLDKNPNFPEISDVNHPNNPNNPINKPGANGGSGSEDNSVVENILGWIGDIFKPDFDFSQTPNWKDPSLNDSDFSIMDPNYIGNLTENGGDLIVDGNGNIVDGNGNIVGGNGSGNKPGGSVNKPGFSPNGVISLPSVNDSIAGFGDRFNFDDYVSNGYKFDSEGLLSKPDGTLVESNGYYVNSHGNLVSKETGKEIIINGNKVNINGLQVDKDGKPIIVDGSLVDMDGNLVDLNGNYIIVGGHKVNQDGILVQIGNNKPVISNGYQVNKDGLLIDGNKKPIMVGDNYININGLQVDKNSLKPITVGGYYVNKNNLLVNTNGSMLKKDGYFVNSDFLLVKPNGQLLEVNGYYVNSNGYLVDKDGNVHGKYGNDGDDGSSNGSDSNSQFTYPKYDEDGQPIIDDSSLIVSGDSSFDNSEDLDDLFELNTGNELKDKSYTVLWLFVGLIVFIPLFYILKSKFQKRKLNKV